MGLPQEAPTVPSWRQLGTPVLEELRPRLPRMCWEVWFAMCKLQAGRNRYVMAGADRLGVMTGHNRRAVYRARKRLEEAGLIRRVTTGGGRVLAPEKGSPGEASTFVLGPAVEAYQEGRRRPLRVVKNSDIPVTVVDPDYSDAPVTVGTVTARSPHVRSSSGLRPSSSSPDDEREGRPASRPAPGSHPDVRPGPDTFTRLGSLLKAGPQPVPESLSSPITDLLGTPVTPGPDLELKAPKRRRR